MSRPITIPAKESEDKIEVIVSIAIVPGESVMVDTRIADIVDSNIVIDYENVANKFAIQGDSYIELISIRPTWHPTKDSEYWDERDLWYIIDEIKSGNLSNEIPVEPEPQIIY